MISSVIFFILGFAVAMAIYDRKRLIGWLQVARAWIHNKWQNFSRKR